VENPQDDGPVPPVKQLKDVPPEEWDYSNRQAAAGCGVVAAVLFGLFLPPTLELFVDKGIARAVGFGIAGVVALLSIVVIVQLTRRKRTRPDPAQDADSHSSPEIP
jgi:protein-S-isoprenylcysteine O-methyltransferase Ste14